MVKQLQGLSIRTKIMVPLGLVIVVALGLTFYFVEQSQETQIIQQVNSRAKALFENAVLTRAWVANQGGVYIKKQGDVETNPYLLQIPDLLVDFEGQNGDHYTLRNPALVTRELSELGAERGESFAFRITSLDPVNPGNAPTEWETAALRSFEQGEKEASLIDTTGKTDTYRYMAPLVVTEACLKCHAAQGYKLGDIRGGISVAVPMANARAVITETRRRLLLTALFITVVMLVIVYIVVNYLVIKPLEEVETTARQISQGQLEKQVPLRANDELGSLAHSFNDMTSQLRQSLESTEQQVRERTKRLETAAGLTERFSAILDLNILLTEVVNQIKDTFNYYHAHVYLLDNAQKNLVLAEGAGAAGKEMKRKGHSIPLAATQSLVARAARFGDVVYIDNVRQSKDWLPNPLLPNTCSEMAVPIKIGEKQEVIGVLDVQQNTIAGLDEGDANLLRSLAAQVAVAVNNARLFSKVETALAETRAAQERYTAASWDRTKINPKSRYHFYAQPNAAKLSTEIRADARQQALTQTQPAIVTINEQDTPQSVPPIPESAAKETKVDAIVAPVTANNKTIGTLQLYRAKNQTGQTVPWSADDLIIIEAVIDQIAQSAENMRLFGETRERAAREQFVGQISDKLRRAPDFETLMKIGVDEITRILEPSRTFVQIGPEDELGKQPPPDFDEAAAEKTSTKPQTTPVTPVSNNRPKPIFTNGQGDKQ